MSQDNAPDTALDAPAIAGGAPTPHPKELRQRAFALYQEGKPYVDIAHELRVPAPTLRAWSHRDNWEQRKQIVTVAPAIDAETVAKLAKQSRPPIGATSGLDLAEKQARYQEQMGEAAIRVSEYVSTLDAKEIIAQAPKIKQADDFQRKALKLEQDKPTTIIQIGLLNTPQARTDSKQAALEAVTIDD